MAQPGNPQVDGEQSFLNATNLAANAKVINFSRTSLSAVAGIATGILGCTGIMGLGMYLLTYATVSLALLSKMGFERSVYTAAKKDASPLGFLFEGMFGLALTFILFWTLAYALVYVY